MIITILYFYVYDYYQLTSIGIVSIPFFVLGMWVGKQSFEDKKISVFWILFFIGLWMFFYKYPFCSWLNLKESFYNIIGIATCTMILSWLSPLSFLHSLLKWFGKYTLEIYVLHLMLHEFFYCYIPNGYYLTTVAVVGALSLCVPIHLLSDLVTRRINTIKKK